MGMCVNMVTLYLYSATVALSLHGTPRSSSWTTYGLRVVHMTQVESAALNEASHTDKGPCGKKDGPVFHTRGLTLSEEHRSAGQALQHRSTMPALAMQCSTSVSGDACSI